MNPLNRQRFFKGFRKRLEKARRAVITGSVTSPRRKTQTEDDELVMLF